MMNSKLVAILCNASKTINSALVHEEILHIPGGRSSAIHRYYTHKQTTAISAKRATKNSTPKAMAIFWIVSAGSEKE